MNSEFLEAIDLPYLFKEYCKHAEPAGSPMDLEVAHNDFGLSLKSAVEMGFLIKTEGGAFKFSHDRVRQAGRSIR